MTIPRFDLRTMLDAVQEIKAPSTFFMSLLFPPASRQTFDTESVDFDYVAARRRLAPFSNINLPGTIIGRDGYTMQTVTPPNIAPVIPITGADLQTRAPGRHVYNPQDPSARADELLGEDLSKLKVMITRTIEWMIASVLQDETITLFGAGVGAPITFPRAAAHQRARLAGADRWDVGTSDPLGDIRSWSEAIRQSTGLYGDTLVLGQGAGDALLRNPVLAPMLDRRRLDLGLLAPEIIESGVTYLGRLAGTLVEIYQYTEWFEDPTTGVEGPLLDTPLGDESVAVMFSSKAPTKLCYGAVPVAQGEGDEAYITLVRGEMVPVSWTESDPARRFLKLQARPLPVLQMNNAVYVRDVL